MNVKVWMKRKKTLVLEESFSDHISRGRPRYKSGRPFFVGTTPDINRDDPDTNRGDPISSGRQDSNLRPLAPHASALPGCATSRNINAVDRAANL